MASFISGSAGAENDMIINVNSSQGAHAYVFDGYDSSGKIKLKDPVNPSNNRTISANSSDILSVMALCKSPNTTGPGEGEGGEENDTTTGYIDYENTTEFDSTTEIW